MKFFYPFLVAMLGIVSIATGQNYPINNDANLKTLFTSDMLIRNEGNDNKTTFGLTVKSSADNGYLTPSKKE